MNETGARTRRWSWPLGLLLSALLLAGCGESDAQEAEPAFTDPNGIDESFLDLSANPCDDFYQFACGSWIREHPTTTASPVTYRFNEGYWRNVYFLKSRLDQAGSAANQYYSACMTAQQAQASSRELEPLLTTIRQMQSVSELGRVLGGLHAKGVGALFSLYIASDLLNPAERVVNLGPGGFTLPGRDYYVDPELSVSAELAEHIDKLLAAYGSLAIALDAPGAVELETALARSTLSNADARADDEYHPQSVEELARQATHFDWDGYFGALTDKPIARINLRQPNYLAQLDAELTTISLTTLKTELILRTLESYGNALGKQVSAEEDRFHNGLVLGDSDQRPEWYTCLLATADTYGFELAKQLVATVFTAQEKNSVVSLVENLRGALREDLQTLPWLDAPSRSLALGKLDQMIAQVGYPDPKEWPAPSTFETRGSYLALRIALSTAQNESSWSVLDEPVDRKEWLIAPIVTNAFYNPQRNAITVPAGILSLPHYSSERAELLNYAAIGSIIGHELTHGFDDVGRRFDGVGRLDDAWSKESADAFRERASCLSDQYSAYEAVPGIHLDGEATLGENIADLGGLKLARAAHLAAGGSAELRGSLNDDQQFYVAYAQLWCASMSEEALTWAAVSDPHSPPRFRVNGVARNLPDFARTFDCPAGSAMAPADRCELF